ncbi:not available [Pontoporia blainvillei]|uniref:Not available n=1 Tax=Pontoporia blainvillei TaxID=48723 RepID=A0ABX0S3U2_PONBL|nr:not available [Pontoporia blainvillei]
MESPAKRISPRRVQPTAKAPAGDGREAESSLLSRESTATFHGKNVFRPPEAGRPQPMSQGAAAATAESLPRQTASTLTPYPILSQALSPSHPSGLGHSEGSLQAKPHRQAPLPLAGPWPSASPQHGPRCKSPVLQDVYLPPEKWACFERAPESPQQRCSGVTPEPGLRPWTLAFRPGTSQLPAIIGRLGSESLQADARPSSLCHWASLLGFISRSISETEHGDDS